MNVVERYKSAREIYKKVGVDTDLAIRNLIFPFLCIVGKVMM